MAGACRVLSLLLGDRGKRSNLSEQADHHRGPVRARQRQRPDRPHHRRNGSAPRSARASSSRTSPAPTAPSRRCRSRVRRRTATRYSSPPTRRMSAAPSLQQEHQLRPDQGFRRAVAASAASRNCCWCIPIFRRNRFQELIAYAKANPGKLSFASANASSVVAGETLEANGPVSTWCMCLIAARRPRCRTCWAAGSRCCSPTWRPDCRITSRRVARARDHAPASAARWCRNCRRSMSPASKASTWTPGRRVSYRPTRRPTSLSRSSTPNCARSSTIPR